VEEILKIPFLFLNRRGEIIKRGSFFFLRGRKKQKKPNGIKTLEEEAILNLIRTFLGD